MSSVHVKTICFSVIYRFHDDGNFIILTRLTHQMTRSMKQCLLAMKDQWIVVSLIEDLTSRVLVLKSLMMEYF